MDFLDVELDDNLLCVAYGIDAGLRIRYSFNITKPDGERKLITTELPNTADRSRTSTRIKNLPRCTVTSARAQVFGGTIGGPGELLVEAALDRRGHVIGTLFQDYLTLSQPAYPNSGPKNPLDGPGRLYWLTVADDVTPGTGVTTTLAATNARRLIHGFAWYYHAGADVADRTMRALMHQPGPSLPTGMTAGNKTRPWANANAVTVSAGQEGLIFAKDGIVAEVDNGVVAYNNNSTQPNPFPLLVEEDDIADLDLVVGAAETADRHSAHILMEEWIDP